MGIPRTKLPPEADEEIRAVYRRRGPRALPPTSALANKYKVSPNVIYRRALELGEIAGPVELNRIPWNADELALLDGSRGLSVPRIQTKLRKIGSKRSNLAIVRKIQEIYGTAAEFRQEGGYYTSGDLAKEFGVNNNVVISWVKRGVLRATASKVGEKYNQYISSAKDVRDFIIQYTGHAPFTERNKYFIVDILMGENGGKPKAPGKYDFAGISVRDSEL